MSIQDPVPSQLPVQTSESSSETQTVTDISTTEANIPKKNETKETSALLISEQTARRLVKGVNSLGNMLLILSLVIACFHPWTKQAVEEALSITPLLLLVLIFIYVVNPLVEFLMAQIRKLPGAKLFSYTKSLIVTYIILLTALMSFLAVITPSLFSEIKNLAESFPTITKKSIAILIEFRHHHLEALPVNLQNQIMGLINQIGSVASDLINSGIQYAGAFSSAIIWVATAAVMVPFISFYIMSEGQELTDFWIELLPPKNRQATKNILIQMHTAMKSFIKGQVLLCFAVGSLTTLLMSLVMPKYCIALGIIAGITEAIPIIGPILGALPAIFLALALPNTGGVTLAVIVAAIYILIQQAENNLLVPKIMGDSLGLHPLSLMIGMMVFGNVFGFWGIVLSSPIIAAVKILVIHYCNPALETKMLQQIQKQQNSEANTTAAPKDA
ncbi:MAG: AI-2E family transporter [Candidatus Bruticola sp.]